MTGQKKCSYPLLPCSFDCGWVVGDGANPCFSGLTFFVVCVGWLELVRRKPSNLKLIGFLVFCLLGSGKQ